MTLHFPTASSNTFSPGRIHPRAARGLAAAPDPPGRRPPGGPSADRMTACCARWRSTCSSSSGSSSAGDAVSVLQPGRGGGGRAAQGGGHLRYREPLGFEIDRILVADAGLRQPWAAALCVTLPGCLFRRQARDLHDQYQARLLARLYWDKMDASRFQEDRFRMAVMLRPRDGSAQPLGAGGAAAVRRSGRRLGRVRSGAGRAEGRTGPLE